MQWNDLESVTNYKFVVHYESLEVKTHTQSNKITYGKYLPCIPGVLAPLILGALGGVLVPSCTDGAPSFIAATSRLVLEPMESRELFLDELDSFSFRLSAMLCM